MNYDEYLFSCLLKLRDREFALLPYDEQFKNLPRMFHEFEDSKFNDANRSTYDCINEYLEKHLELPYHVFENGITLTQPSDEVENPEVKIESVQVRPVLLTGGDTLDATEETANAFGVYLRYTPVTFEKFKLNPSEWIADFDTILCAERFAELLTLLIKKGM